MREVEAGWRGAVFVCTHDREPETGRACCGLEAGVELRTWLKARMKEAGLKGQILTAKSGCLDVCSPLGVTIVAVPESGTPRGRRMWIVEAEDDREALFQSVCAALGAEDGPSC